MGTGCRIRPDDTYRAGSPHTLDAMPTAPPPAVPVRVDPLMVDLGTVEGHRVVLLSLEVYEAWADLRFARIAEAPTQPLPRRVPPAEAWTVRRGDQALTVLDAVGRGDRDFSNGEVRLAPPPPPGAALDVAVTVLAGAPPLVARVTAGTA